MKSVAKKTVFQMAANFSWMALGAFLAALSIRMFLYPNELIDGGVIGISLILARLLGDQWLSLFMIALNIPFIYLASIHIRKTFVVQMGIAVGMFAVFLMVLENVPAFVGDSLEIIVFGGGILGIGVGLIIRNGGCTDGTEILGIIINRRFGYTVGQVVMFINVFVFGAYGWIFLDWHIALKSIMTYIVAFKMMDMVIVGLDELKSVMIVTSLPEKLSKCITEELGLGLTVMYGRGGYTGQAREILMVIVERLDLAELKELVQKEDPQAFIAIENLHEVVYSKGSDTKGKSFRKKRDQESLYSKVLSQLGIKS